MLSLAVECIVIGPVCLCVCLWICYHENSKLHASIFAKLGLKVKVTTFTFKPISSWLNFWRSCTPGRGSAVRWNFLALPYYSQRAVFASFWALFFIVAVVIIEYLHPWTSTLSLTDGHSQTSRWRSSCITSSPKRRTSDIYIGTSPLTVERTE